MDEGRERDEGGGRDVGGGTDGSFFLLGHFCRRLIQAVAYFCRGNAPVDFSREWRSNSSSGAFTSPFGSTSDPLLYALAVGFGLLFSGTSYWASPYTPAPARATGSQRPQKVSGPHPPQQTPGPQPPLQTPDQVR